MCRVSGVALGFGRGSARAAVLENLPCPEQWIYGWFSVYAYKAKDQGASINKFQMWHSLGTHLNLGTFFSMFWRPLKVLKSFRPRYRLPPVHQEFVEKIWVSLGYSSVIRAEKQGPA